MVCLCSGFQDKKLFKIILKITVICSSRTPLLISHERQEHNVRNEYKIEKKYTVK